MNNRELFEKTKQENRSWLLEHEAKQVLQNMNILIPPSKLVLSEVEAIESAKKFGFPVVLKLMSKDVMHKTDSGAVVIDLSNEQEVKETYNDFMRRFENIEIAGVLVEKMVKKGLELIIGTSTDSTFGPVILFGVGGVLVEAIKDVVFRMCPVTKKQALGAIGEIKAKILLEGFRGQPKVNKDQLADILVKISQLAWENREYITEMDINPIIANEDGIFPVDARIILK
ncbi:MAG: acetate--CoA ligase family protein [Candidatus Heimdallarchaeota archaeon]|jgi:3-hydroxypropionyl-CoA synthetase (ADP-forming)|nr:acetate--CoA ligase family protein [Candidatus Heimdallarchaeota archaeon]MCK4254688.1 acetate--CoA ligase family protein [Candidatus Heimdallarchaeota archaeon]